MDDESGELMELMEEVPLKELGDAELEKSASLTEGSRELIPETEGKHTGRNNLSFVEKKNGGRQP